MSISRRKFLAGCAVTGGAALASTDALAAPFRVSVRREGDPQTPSQTVSTASGPHTGQVPFAIPATMAMGSGAPLGGIGTGFVEIRPDGGFYEWQIFNAGPWGQNVPSTTAPASGPQYLRFLLHVKKASDPVAQIRRLYLRSEDDSDLYSLPFAQDIESIDYYSYFPVTEVHYNDPTLPVRVSAKFFSPFFPGNARESATPGFHAAFTVENLSAEPVDVTLIGVLDNPLASALPIRNLTNQVVQENDTTSLFFQTGAQADFPSGIGNMCFSVNGGQPSYISGTFREYMLPGLCYWKTDRVHHMVVDFLKPLITHNRLPNTTASTDPSLHRLSDAQIDALSNAEALQRVHALASDALLAHIFQQAQQANPENFPAQCRELLKEVNANLAPEHGKPRLTWGTGALASTMHLAPGQKADPRFTLSWFFPHHLAASGEEMGHMYANWFKDALEVNRFLCANYARHREATLSFAQTLAHTSLGDPIAFAWSSQLSTMVFNTWWIKDGGYAIWEGLGCCGLSTTDVDYEGSFSAIALFPELKTSQMKRIIAFQNKLGQVPHNFSGELDRVDRGFDRVDMNPQFVMMAYRDYLWTGDHAYLNSLWPHIVRAMDYTGSLDTNGDGLPDRNTGLQTYDQWSMRGTPSYVASLWIGALRAAIRIAESVHQPDYAKRWTALLAKASATFDRMLFNGSYYSLWVDGSTRDELCMADQTSGEWFSHLIGLPSTISRDNLDRALDSIIKNNFNPEFGLHNATAPKGGLGLLALTNFQAGGVWSGIEFGFASYLMDHGRYQDGIRLVEATHRRYLRAGRPWNQVECGGHYTRAMSSWATMLAATGFKPDVPHAALSLVPTVEGDFHAPWVMASGFGTITRSGRALTIHCSSGKLAFKSLTTGIEQPSARLKDKPLTAQTTKTGPHIRLTFPATITIGAGDSFTLRST